MRQSLGATAPRWCLCQRASPAGRAHRRWRLRPARHGGQRHRTPAAAFPSGAARCPATAGRPATPRRRSLGAPPSRALGHRPVWRPSLPMPRGCLGSGGPTRGRFGRPATAAIRPRLCRCGPSACRRFCARWPRRGGRRLVRLAGRLCRRFFAAAFLLFSACAGRARPATRSPMRAARWLGTAPGFWPTAAARPSRACTEICGWGKSSETTARPNRPAFRSGCCLGTRPTARLHSRPTSAIGRAWSAHWRP